MHDYLIQLTIRLSEGMAKLPGEFRGRHAAYLKAAQLPDGGFAGREGDSDLYYTGFAARSLAVLGELDGEPATQLADFLQSRLGGRESIVDFFSLIYAASLLDAASGIDVFVGAPGDWRQAVSDTLGSLRRKDGGYAKGPEGSSSSTYHTFLVLLCLQLIDMPVERPREVVDFVLSQQCLEGGFRDIRVQKRAGTNPTAAAIGALRLLDAMNQDVESSTIDFIAEMQTDEGGLRANTRIPIADLLSTFTGSFTLSVLNASDAIDVPAAARYVQSLENNAGGFYGAAWDEALDVEYTFYGLGATALLTTQE